MTREIVSTSIKSLSKGDWATPGPLFGVLNDEFGFDIDLFAAWYNTKLEHYISPESDSLSVDWMKASPKQRGFANPEYSNIEACLKKAVYERERGFFSVFVVPSNTDTQWFPLAAQGELQFFEGRIKFDDVTPAPIEARRLFALAKRRPTNKNLDALSYCYHHRVVEDLRTVEDREIFIEVRNWIEDTEGERDFREQNWVEDMNPQKKLGGPGFPSMLVILDPEAPKSPGTFRRRSAKTGRLIT